MLTIILYDVKKAKLKLSWVRNYRPTGFNRKKYQMLDQLLKPMREMNIDTTEFAAFKTIFFLNPGWYHT